MCVVAVPPEVDLMHAVQVPMPDSHVSQGVDYTAGIDRYPSFFFTNESNVQLPAEKLLGLPQQLWADFSLLAVFRPLRPEGGFLFAVVSSSGTLVQFGLRIADDGPGSSKVQLYYTDHRGLPPVSAVIAEFTVRPPLTGSWNQLAMKVKGDHVTLLPECNPQESVTVTDRIRGLPFQHGSIFYVAQAGPEFADAKFEVDVFTTRVAPSGFTRYYMPI